MELAVHDGDQTMALFDEVQEVYAQAFPGYDLEDHRRRTERQAKSPGFAAVTARLDGVLVGAIYGLPLATTTSWWAGLDPPQDREFLAESGTRTFAVIDLAVLPASQGRGIGRSLMAALLRSRPEERATLAAAPAKTEIARMYERWGWRRVGQVPGDAGETQSIYDLYVVDLH